MSLNKVTLTGTYLDGSGNPLFGTVTFAPSVPLTDTTDSEIVLQSPVTVAVNSAGQFSVALYGTDDADLAPSGWTWQITENIAGLTPSTWSFFLAYADSSTQDLSTLAPVAEVTPVASYLLSTGGPLSGTLDLNGSPPLKLPSGTSGEVLTSDGAGNLTLQPPGESLLLPSNDTSGATDQAAITAAEGTGRVVSFGPGTFWVTGLTKQTGTIWQGSGRLETVIKLAAGANADVIQGAGFATLTLSGNNTGGISGWGIRDLSIDGNYTAQSGTSYGLRVYGYEFDLRNVSIRNCLSWGLYTEWGTYGQPGADESMEAHYENLEIHSNQQGGWHDRGPHDSRSTGVVVWGNGTGYPNYWAESCDITPTLTSSSNGVDVSTFTSGSPGTLHVSSTLCYPTASISATQGAITVVTALGTATLTYTGTTATSFTGCVAHGAGSGSTVSTGAAVTAVGVYTTDGTTHTGMHGYGSGASWQYLLDAGIALDTCTAEFAATGMVLIRGWGCQVLGGDFFATGSPTGCGIQIGDSNNTVSITQVSAALVRGLGNTSSSTASLNLASDLGDNEFRLAVYAPSGSDVVAGTLNPGSICRVAAFGQGASANNANSVWLEPGSLTLGGALSAGGGATFGNTATVEAVSALFQAVNTGTVQYDGSGVTLYSDASSMGTQGGANMYAGIANVGATQGFFTIDQVDHTGTYVGHLLYFDLNGQTASLHVPLNMNSQKVTALAYGSASTDAVAYGQLGTAAFQGLAPTGVTATDTANVQGLMNLGVQNVVLGAGNFSLSEITYPAGTACAITGAGIALTTLTWSTSDYAISFAGNTGTPRFDMSQMSLVQNGTGDLFQCGSSSSNRFPQFTCYDVNFTLGSSNTAGMLLNGATEPSGSAVLADSIFTRCNFFTQSSTRTNPGVSLIGMTGGGLSNVTWLKCGFFPADASEYCVSLSVYAAAGDNNFHASMAFRDCRFEKPLGGAIYSLSGRNLTLDNCVFWDLSTSGNAALGASLIYIGTQTNQIVSEGTRIMGCCRDLGLTTGSNAGTGVWDIRFDSSVAQALIDSFTTVPGYHNSANPAYFNFGSCHSVTVLNPQDSTATDGTAYQITNPAVNLVQPAPLASPVFTGSPSAPTQAAGDDTTKIATDQFVTTVTAVYTRMFAV